MSTFRKEGNESENMGFNKDSIILYKYWMKSGKNIKYEFYDLKGKVLTSVKKATKYWISIGNPDGTLRKDGRFLKGNRDGEWHYYNAIGYKPLQRYIRKGNKKALNIPIMADGTIKSESQYVNDQLDGYFRHYHPNGKISYEGW